MDRERAGRSTPGVGKSFRLTRAAEVAPLATCRWVSEKAGILAGRSGLDLSSDPVNTALTKGFLGGSSEVTPPHPPACRTEISVSVAAVSLA
jgi:hypothetical protein